MIKNILEIQCDHCPAKLDGFKGDNGKNKARQLARLQGWTYRKIDTASSRVDLCPGCQTAMGLTPPTSVNDMREVWAMVSESPGIPLRSIATALGCTVYRAGATVDTLVMGGTLLREPGKAGTLRAPIPLLTIKEVRK